MTITPLDFVWAFLIGGVICLLAQLVLDFTRLTQAHVMVLFVALGAIATGLGFYEGLVDMAGAGATVPLTGFGYALVSGMADAVKHEGTIGLLTGGISATALGIATAVLAGYTMAAICSPKS